MRALSLVVLLFLARAWSCGSSGFAPEALPTVIRAKRLSAEEQMLVKKGYEHRQERIIQPWKSLEHKIDIHIFRKPLG